MGMLKDFWNGVRSGFNQATQNGSFHAQAARLCAACGWAIHKKTDGRVQLRFEDGGRGWTVAVFDRSPMEMVAVFGSMMFPPGQVPHPLSSALLARSGSRSVGFWAALENEDGVCFVCAYHLPLGVVTPEQFGGVVKELVGEMIEVEDKARAKGLIE